MAGGIIGVDDDHAACAWRDSLLERMHVNVPAVIVKQRIARELYVIHISQEVEEWIAGSGDQEFVAGIAEQAKNERVSFTGAGGEEQIVYGDMLGKSDGGDRRRGLSGFFTGS